jgi:hypothetical protein
MFNKQKSAESESAELVTPDETPREPGILPDEPGAPAEPAVKEAPEKVTVGKAAATISVNSKMDLRFRVGKQWVDVPKGRSKVTRQVYEILLQRDALIAV